MKAVFALRQLGGKAPGGRRPASAGQGPLASGYTLAILTLIYALNGADRQLLGLLLPLVKVELRLSDSMLGVATGAAFVLVYSLLSIPIARVADRSNRRNILSVGLAVWSLATLATGAVANWVQLVLCRLALGAGESAATAPPASMLFDIFRGSSRGLALSIFASSAAISGLLLLPAFAAIAEHGGWRMAFFCAGAFGLGLSVLLVTTVREPARPAPTAGSASQDGLKETVSFLLSSRTYLFVLLGGGLIGITLFSGQAWNASFLARVHHLNIVEIGFSLGLVKGIAGLGGTIAGGWLSERLSQRRPHWRLTVPGIACLAALPAELLFLFAAEPVVSLIGYGLVQFAIGMHMGPILVICHYISRDAMRATATAAYMVTTTIFGQILGPLAVGYCNDLWANRYGDEAIRYSLILAALCVFAAGASWILASVWLGSDMQRARPEPAARRA